MDRTKMNVGTDSSDTVVPIRVIQWYRFADTIIRTLFFISKYQHSVLFLIFLEYISLSMINCFCAYLFDRHKSLMRGLRIIESISPNN